MDTKAEFLDKMFKASAAAADSIRISLSIRDGRENAMPAVQAVSVCVEFICLYLHLTFKMAYARLEKGDADNLVKNLPLIIMPVAVNSYFPSIPQDDKWRLINDFIDDFETSNSQYAMCQLWNADGSSEGTLLWEFGKVIAELLDRQDDLALIRQCQKIAWDWLEIIDIASYLQVG